jgi:hypothetical protein
MALFSVELLLEIDAPSAADAAALAILEARTATGQLTMDVYSETTLIPTNGGTDRCWERVIVDVRALDAGSP